MGDIVFAHVADPALQKKEFLSQFVGRYTVADQKAISVAFTVVVGKRAAVR